MRERSRVRDLPPTLKKKNLNILDNVWYIGMEMTRDVNWLRQQKGEKFIKSMFSSLERSMITKCVQLLQ